MKKLWIAGAVISLALTILGSGAKAQAQPTVYAAQCAVSSSKSSWPCVLKKGNKNAYVSELQQTLYDMGYLKVKPTGYFGTLTQSAVISFQKDNGLATDGKAGPKTYAALYGNTGGSSTGVQASSLAGTDDIQTMYPGDRGDNVSDLQSRLKELGFYNYSRITGFYGPITQQAVKDFQQANKLKADGIAGRNTLDALNSGSAKDSSASSGQAAVQSVASGKVETLVSMAMDNMGKQYRWGGSGPNSFDCSGFVSYLLKQMGKSTPRTSYDMSLNESWTKVSYDELKKGDLVFFDTYSNSNPPIGHVGIYLGEGQFIHCSSAGGEVMISYMVNGYYFERFRWGRRVFED